MKTIPRPKLLLCLALVLGGGLANKAASNPCVPVVPAPKMRACEEASVKDLGYWDDIFRFKGLDFVVLRRGKELYSYSPAAERLEKIRTVPEMLPSEMVNGKTWGKHQWLFCSRSSSSPMAMDLASGQEVFFETHQGHNEIHEIYNSGGEAGTLVLTSAGFYWMDLESGKVLKLHPGGGLQYFSPDQKLAVFEGKSTNAWEYAPWVVVDMATGRATNTLPDQTKGLWSDTIGKDWWNEAPPLAWELRTARTPMRLLKPQQGRGYIDDLFAGLCLNGVPYVIHTPDTNTVRCTSAWLNDSLGVFALTRDGGGEEFLWAARLRKSKPDDPVLLATNGAFYNGCELLGPRRCVFVNRPASEAMVYDVESKTAWNILDQVPLLAEMKENFHEKNKELWGKAYSGLVPQVSFRLIPGFGSDHYSKCVLCLCSAYMPVSDFMIPATPQQMMVLLTVDGDRYEMKLPNGEWEAKQEALFTGPAWLHNSGKLIFCEDVPPANKLGRWHVYMADLHAGGK